MTSTGSLPRIFLALPVICCAAGGGWSAQVVMRLSTSTHRRHANSTPITCASHDRQQHSASNPRTRLPHLKSVLRLATASSLSLRTASGRSTAILARRLTSRQRSPSPSATASAFCRLRLLTTALVHGWRRRQPVPHRPGLKRSPLTPNPGPDLDQLLSPHGTFSAVHGWATANKLAFAGRPSSPSRLARPGQFRPRRYVHRAQRLRAGSTRRRSATAPILTEAGFFERTHEERLVRCRGSHRFPADTAEEQASAPVPSRVVPAASASLAGQHEGGKGSAEKVLTWRLSTSRSTR